MPCTVVTSRAWRHMLTGQTVSLYGSCPWLNDNDRPNWSIVDRGFTIQNPDGTIGCGRPPCATIEEAQELADRLNALRFTGVNQG